MTMRRTLYLPALIVMAVLTACAAALLAVSEKAEATFPGSNGRIAYTVNNGNDSDIYTIKPDGGGEFKVTDTATDDYSPSWGAVSRGSSLLL
jgi:hypothetical protein